MAREEIPLASLAVKLIVVVPLTVAPLEGALIETLGGVVSAGVP
jgi:hypothetical protein